jgi:4-diphosphocytidyl-2-C-methyl-D-erythritol kinase
MRTWPVAPRTSWRIVWAGGLGSEELASIGAELGSDVPLFFSLPSALITGRGERVEPVALRWSGWVSLAFVDTMVSTAQVYRAWRASDSAAMPGHSVDAATEASSAEELSAMLFNHLEPAVCRVSPAVARAFAVANRPGMGPMRIAGAGSTLYRLFDEKEAACDAAMALADLRADLKTVVVQAPAGPSAIVAEEC